VFVEEAKKQSTHDAFSGDRQFFFAVGVSNDEVHIGEFADFSQGFRLREGSIVLSTGTGIKCFGAASGSSPVVECGLPFFRAHAQGDSQANEDRAYV
jgi:hypothetical protein